MAAINDLLDKYNRVTQGEFTKANSYVRAWDRWRKAEFKLTKNVTVESANCAGSPHRVLC